MLFGKKVRTLVSDLKFPEGPVVDRGGSVFAVQLQSGYIILYHPDGRVEDFINTGGNPNGAAMDTQGNLLVCDSGKNDVLCISHSGDILSITDNYNGEALRGPNDLVVHSSGNIYFTTPVGSNRENPIGRVYRATPDGETVLVADGLAFPNGIALSEDEKTLYVAETQRRQILSIKLGGEGLPAESPALYAKLEEIGEGPDGMAFDVKGRLYVAHYGAGYVAVVGTDGKIERTIDTPGRNPTNVAFGGPDMKTLYITEAEKGLLLSYQNDTPGQRLIHQK